ncbi:MAG: class I SAM-dependent methyltransferase [Candidatus Omnitrophota bacterium]
MEVKEKPPGLIIDPENTHPKFYIEKLYPYYLVGKNAANKRILDVGFGYGHGDSYLAKRAGHVVGIDREFEHAKRAQDKYKTDNLSYCLMDAVNLAVRDEAFDIICSFQVIEHIKEDMLLEYLSTIYKALKTKGIFYVSTLNKEVTMKPGQPYDKNYYHEKEFNAIELKELLLKVFSKVEMYGLQLTLKHRFFQRLKKIGLFKPFPKRINPIECFYKGISFQDFMLSKNNLRKASLDFICFCKK